jgi:hypothetical protein
MASTARMARLWGLRRVSIETWSAFRFELNHDLRLRKVGLPTRVEMSTLASFWGHEGLRQSVRGDAPPPAHLPPEGRRAPLQVMEGNCERLSGVCPWWDAMTAGR